MEGVDVVDGMDAGGGLSSVPMGRGVVAWGTWQ